MALAEKLYAWFADGPAPDVDHILIAGLAHAESPWRERVLRLLLARRREAGWCGLVARFDELPPDVVEGLLSDWDLLHAAIGQVIRQGAPGARTNALRVLELAPHPRMCYALSTALRDSEAPNRVAAAQLMRRVVDEHLTALDKGERRESATERRELIASLREAVRTFDFHRRLEVLETALWLADEVGDDLWRTLRSPRSRAGIHVTQQLYSWSHPRLARFCLTALREPAWRATACGALRGWKSPELVGALLRESACLNDPEVRSALKGVRNPPWFDAMGPELDALPVKVRPLAPRWLAWLGYSEDRRVELVSTWMNAGDPALQRASVYALAQLDGAAPLRRMRALADSASPLARFARWHVIAHDTELVRPARRGAQLTDASEPCPEERLAAADFVLLWQACRRMPLQRRGELIQALRENASAWRSNLGMYLHAPDPRDRILALQVVSTRELAQRYRRQIKPLLNDPIDGIRSLARHLLASGGRGTNDESVKPDDGSPESARARLSARLDELAAEESSEQREQALKEVRELLRRIYGASTKAAKAEAGE